MNTLSDQARQQAARQRLQRSRRIAGGLLLGASGLFAAATYFQPQHPHLGLGYVKAFAEAAMVGGLADWFAVTALFRRPFGLPIPHTAILPNKQDSIANEIGRFAERHFLQGRPIALKVYQAQPCRRLLEWLGSEKAQQQWLPLLSRQLAPLLQSVPPAALHRFSRRLLERQSGAYWGGLLSDGLLLLKKHGLHQQAFDALIKALRGWLQNPATRTLLEQYLQEWAAKIESDAPSTWDKFKTALKTTLVEKVDDWAAAKALDWLDQYLERVQSEPHNTLRKHFDAEYDTWTEKLRQSPQWHQRLEGLAQEAARSEALQRKLAQLQQQAAAWLAADAAADDSRITRQLQRFSGHIHRQMLANETALRRADLVLARLVRGWVGRNKSSMAEFIANKVKSWESAQLVEKLELSVGRDLQYIRINGTLVGGLAGLVIYSVSQWLMG